MFSGCAGDDRSFYVLFLALQALFQHQPTYCLPLVVSLLSWLMAPVTSSITCGTHDTANDRLLCIFVPGLQVSR